MNNNEKALDLLSELKDSLIPSIKERQDDCLDMYIPNLSLEAQNDIEKVLKRLSNLKVVCEDLLNDMNSKLDTSS
jgi:hypothetical protein